MISWNSVRTLHENAEKMFPTVQLHHIISNTNINLADKQLWEVCNIFIINND